MKNFVFSFLLIACNLQLLIASEKQTICLNMIVKNEEKVIARCLESVKDIIDYWVIVDTGSTDQTKEVIKKTMNGIPGEIYDKPFVNFGQTRNEALALAKGKCEYILFMDADDQLVFSPNYAMPVFDKDVYLITNRKKMIKNVRLFFSE